MKFDLPEPFAPINTETWGRPSIRTSASERKPLMWTDWMVAIAATVSPGDALQAARAPVRTTRLPRYSSAGTSTARPSFQDSQTASVKRM